MTLPVGSLVPQALSFPIQDAEGDIAPFAASLVADHEGLASLHDVTGCNVQLDEAFLAGGRVVIPVVGDADFTELQHLFMVPIRQESDFRVGEGVAGTEEAPLDLPAETDHIPACVHSGGQTGADLGGLVGARRAGIATGGIAPKGYRTEKGPQPEALASFGLVEDASAEYDSRTEKNAAGTDATIIFALKADSPGTVKTVRACEGAGKPFLLVDPFEDCLDDIRAFLNTHRPERLNVAGNRESVAPGITGRVAALMANVCERLPEIDSAPGVPAGPVLPI